MATAFLRDRLQPALLDRLMDDRRRYLPPSRRLPISVLGQAAQACVAERARARARAASKGQKGVADTGHGVEGDQAEPTPSQSDHDVAMLAVADQANEADEAMAADASSRRPATSHTSADDDRRVMNKAQLREAVLRDLTWLFNAVQPLSQQQAEATPRVAESVLNYGLPALSGLLASRIDIPWLERMLRQAIVCFEPRVVAATLRVKAVEFNSVLDTHNVIEFEISGELWAQPVPIELLLRTKVDLEAGQVVVRDAAAGSARSARVA